MNEQLTFEFDQRPTIKGFPELRWTGKRPYRSTQYYPAQLRESYGSEKNGWINKIFWGDNLQVMSHLLKEYRGQIDLIYIDPPFDSKADYKRKIEVKGVGNAVSDSSSFEEKQYGDIWTNDEYLQFMYERFVLIRELLSESGSVFLHCDRHRNHMLRCIMDEVFGNAVEKNTPGLVNEIIWFYPDSPGRPGNRFAPKHDTLFWYSKTGKYVFNTDAVKEPILDSSKKRYETTRYLINSQGKRFEYAGSTDGDGLKIPETVWKISVVKGNSNQATAYPTQKPEALIERIINVATNPGDIVFDCFMGSGTTQAVAMKLGRRFIGADINLGAIQTTTKRLLSIAEELEPKKKEVSYEVPTQLSFVAEEISYQVDGGKNIGKTEKAPAPQESVKYTGFEVYNVNNYDFFRNPVEARDLLISALEIQAFPQSDVWDGELDGRMVKIMPVNRIATKADLEELLANLPYKTYEKRKEESPNQPVERITIVCMGHEPDLKAALEQKLVNYKVDVQIVDILRDKADLQLKRDSEAEIVREGDKLIIRAFYPMNLMQKLSLQKEYVEDWRQLVDSIMIDWNYDGVVMQPAVTDIPGKNEMVKGIYDIPEGCGSIKVKITDLLSESLEVEVRA